MATTPSFRSVAMSVSLEPVLAEDLPSVGPDGWRGVARHRPISVDERGGPRLANGAHHRVIDDVEDPGRFDLRIEMELVEGKNRCARHVRCSESANHLIGGQLAQPFAHRRA